MDRACFELLEDKSLEIRYDRDMLIRMVQRLKDDILLPDTTDAPLFLERYRNLMFERQDTLTSPYNGNEITAIGPLLRTYILDIVAELSREAVLVKPEALTRASMWDGYTGASDQPQPELVVKNRNAVASGDNSIYSTLEVKLQMPIQHFNAMVGYFERNSSFRIHWVEDSNSLGMESKDGSLEGAISIGTLNVIAQVSENLYSRDSTIT